MVEETLIKMELTPFTSQLAGTLSGGWKQRLALACCLLHKPQLLLLDEPTAGVDPAARRDFWEQLYLLTAQGISTLISTHYMDEAERCHRVAYLAYGDLLTAGTATDVIRAAGLQTWLVSGASLAMLADRLKILPGVEQVIPFGNSLHVCGTDAGLLTQSLQTLSGAGSCRFEPIDTGLEEVFINLMAKRPRRIADEF